ncbi:MAG: DUF4258 domain-containing protein [bacterium]
MAGHRILEVCRGGLVLGLQLTRHAAERLRERGIKVDDVLAVVAGGRTRPGWRGVVFEGEVASGRRLGVVAREASARRAPDCGLTVGQVEDCLDAALGAQQRELQSVTCGRPLPADAEDRLALDLEGQPACAPLVACQRARSEEPMSF